MMPSLSENIPPDKVWGAQGYITNRIPAIREDRKKEVVENKKSIMVRNFQQAENLRNEAKALKQARFFH